MTVGEISDVLKYAYETEKARRKAQATDAASAAYYSGVFSRCVKLPATIYEAFPELFGHTADGQISVDNIAESERGMDRWFRAYGQRTVN